MAASYSTAVNTVLGDQRTVMGTVHMNDGSGVIDFGMNVVNGAVISQVSCNTGGAKNVTRNHPSGNVYIGSCTSGDSFQFIVCGK